jgi:hypothetical protein
MKRGEVRDKGGIDKRGGCTDKPHLLYCTAHKLRNVIQNIIKFMIFEKKM